MTNPKIFKAYDIRGIYGQDLFEEDAYKIGRACARFFQAKKIAVGRDIRESGPTLYEELKKGIAAEGTDVIDLGIITTPMLYYASGTLDVDGAVILTASHNPAEWNGFKICRKDAQPIGENSGLLDIKKIALEGDLSDTPATGTITKHDIKKNYFDHFSSFMKLSDKKFKVVIDPANAMGVLELELYKRFQDNIEVATIYGELDSKFPSHEPNPLKTETLADLQREVINQKADLGIAYDGDGDRVGFVDEKGEIIPMDLITGMIAKILLESNPGAKILYDLRSSMAVKEIIEENGGISNETRVGHTLIKKQMSDEQALFSGELSGHYYFKENFGAEAGSLPAIYLLNLMAETGESISQLTKEVRRYFHSGEINSKVEDKDKILEKLKETYSTGKISDFDGIKIYFWDEMPKGQRWWFNVRPSNTEPVLRLTLEADTKELMEQKRDEVLAIIRS